MNNRILKFRVWDNRLEDFVTMSQVGDTNYPLFLMLNGFLGIPYYEKSHRMYLGNVGIKSIDGQNTYIIQQFTGLLDKEGKEIYEGDIVDSSVNEKPCHYIIKWSENKSDYCGFVLNPVMKNPPRITYHIHDFKLWMAEGFKVIGNIMENPELLKQ